jgi:histone acetyltransferase
MDTLKKEMKLRDIQFLMTYADNLAIQYFKKQGFNEQIQVPPEIWKGYLKDYDGSTHMECLINPIIDYSTISTQIRAQKDVLLQTNLVRGEADHEVPHKRQNLPGVAQLLFPETDRQL